MKTTTRTVTKNVARKQKKDFLFYMTFGIIETSHGIIRTVTLSNESLMKF